MFLPSFESATPKASIFSLFVVFIFLFSLMVFSINYLFVASRGSTAISELQQQGHRATLLAHGERLEHFVSEHLRVLRELAARPAFARAALSPENNGPELFDLFGTIKILGQSETIALRDADSSILFASEGKLFVSVNPDTRWFAEIGKGHATSDVRLVASSENPDLHRMVFSVPVPGRGRPKGVLTAEVKLLPDLSNVFGDTIDRDREGVAVSKDGVTVTNIPALKDNAYIAKVDVGESGMTLRYAVDATAAARTKRNLMVDFAIGLALSTMVAFAFFWFFGNRIIVAPYDRLAALQVGISNAAEGIAKIGADRRIQFANNAYAASFDMTAREIVGKRWPDLVPNTSARERMMEAHATARHDGRAAAEMSYVAPSGRPIHKQMTLVRGDSEGSGARGFYIFEVDIATRVAMERDLKRSAADLERSNADLQRFAFAASHDLKEPLRKIEMCCSLLAADHKADLDDEGAELVEIAADGAGRMRRLIDDLLALSRVNTRDLAFAETSLHKPLNDALANLQSQISGSGAVIETAPLPTLPIAGGLIRQVFQNLVSNAISYRSEGALKITIDAEDRGQSWRIRVSDNGAGIKPEYAERIFNPFERLAGARADNDAGNGIGLALCKRIIERHNGRIWLSTRFKSGSRFVFELPKRHHETGAEAA